MFEYVGIFEYKCVRSCPFSVNQFMLKKNPVALCRTSHPFITRNIFSTLECFGLQKFIVDSFYCYRFLYKNSTVTSRSPIKPFCWRKTLSSVLTFQIRLVYVLGLPQMRRIGEENASASTVVIYRQMLRRHVVKTPPRMVVKNSGDRSCWEAHLSGSCVY